MIELFTVVTEVEELKGCSYGSEQRGNQVVKSDQIISLILTLTFASLLYNRQLRRLYLPLARLVNVSIILKIISTSFYFAYYPYGPDDGNCTEIFLSRCYNGIIMLAELHQVYLIAHLLGLGKISFRFCGKYLSLTTFLNIMTTAIIITILVSMWIRKLLRIRGLWTFGIACLQLYIIRQSRLPNVINDQGSISGNSSSVKLYERMSYHQLFPAAVSFIKRFLETFFGLLLLGPNPSISNLMDEICVIFFDLKILVIIENADVTIETVPDH